MATLNDYLKETQRLLGDVTQAQFNPADLISYINRSRREVAAEGQCIRQLPTIQGHLVAVTVLSSSAYTIAPDVIISLPDSPPGFAPNPNGVPATAVATLSGGVVSAISLTNSGVGYFSPIVTIASGNVLATATISPVNVTIPGQEVYTFSSLTPLVATSGSGVESIHQVTSISLLWGTFRYTLAWTSFSKYQALVRSYSQGYQYIPAVFSQFGQGVNGSVYLYPIPNSVYQMEWDCCCLPTPLASDSDPEVIPFPWTQAVPYYAAHLALETIQTAAAAQRAEQRFQQFERHMKRARVFNAPHRVVNWYGRG